MTDQELVDALEHVWSSTLSVGGALSEADWSMPTDCPGWTAKDVVAHLIGIESTIQGQATPDVEVPDSDHVRGEVARMNEAWVESMRSMTGSAVLERFERVSGDRLAELRALDAAGFAADAWTPVGPGTVRQLLPFRIFDSWVHEQDIRLAVGRPGALHGPGAEASLARCIDTMGYVIGKKVAPPDGTTVSFDLEPPMAARFAIGVDGGRARRLTELPSAPTVRIGATGETFVRLACGRLDPDAADVMRDGDTALGAAVVANLNFLF